MTSSNDRYILKDGIVVDAETGDHLIFGGDRHVINQFLKRARFPDNLSDRILERRVNTLRPSRNALKDAARQAWSSTIYELAT